MSEIRRKQRQERFEKRFGKINLLFSYFSRISSMSRESRDQFEIYLNAINPSVENTIVTLEVRYRFACDTKCHISDLYKKYDLSKYRKEMNHENEQFWRNITNIRIVFKNGQIGIQYRTKRDKEYHIVKEDWYEVRNVLVGNSDKEITFRNDKRRTDVVIGVRMRNFKKEVVIATRDEEEYILYDMTYLMNFESLNKLNSMITRDMMRLMDKRMKEMEERLLKMQDDTEDRIVEMIEDVLKKKENEIRIDPEKKRIKVSFTKEYFEMDEEEDMSSMKKDENDTKSINMKECDANQ